MIYPLISLVLQQLQLQEQHHMLITIATKSTDTDSETDNQNSTALHQAVKKPILKLKSATKAPDQTFRKNKKCAIENLSSDTEKYFGVNIIWFKEVLASESIEELFRLSNSRSFKSSKLTFLVNFFSSYFSIYSSKNF